MRTHKHILAKPLCKCKLALFLSILYCLAGLNASSLRKVGMNPSINPIIKMILLLLCNFEKKKKKISKKKDILIWFFPTTQHENDQRPTNQHTIIKNHSHLNKMSVTSYGLAPQAHLTLTLCSSHCDSKTQCVSQFLSDSLHCALFASSVQSSWLPYTNTSKLLTPFLPAEW